MPSSRWPTQSKLKVIFGGSLSQVVLMDFFVWLFSLLLFCSVLFLTVQILCIHIITHRFVPLGGFCVCKPMCLCVYMWISFFFFGSFFYLFVSSYFSLYLLYLIIIIYMPVCFFNEKHKESELCYERRTDSWRCWGRENNDQIHCMKNFIRKKINE